MDCLVAGANFLLKVDFKYFLLFASIKFVFLSIYLFFIIVNK